MEETDPRVRSMLRQAQRVAESGKRAAAEKLYRQLLDESPEVVPAWLGLAQLLRDPAEKESAYQQVLSLQPGNEAALAGLEAINSPEAIAPATVLEPVEDAPAPAEQEALPPVPQSGNGKVTTTKVATETDELFCTNHPNRRTNLRCNRCGRPMCTRCVQLTPVGYRCKECVREQQDVYYNATALHYLLGAIIALPLGAIGGFVADALSFWVIFIAAGAGTLMGRIVFRLIGRRRGRWLPHLVAVMLVVGAMGGMVIQLVVGVAFLMAGTALPFSMGGFIWSLVFAIVAAGSAYYQMK